MKLFLLLTLGALLANAQPIHARRALLISNSRYKIAAPLRTPASDVRVVETAFQKLGYTTTIVENATVEGIATATAKLAASIKPGDAVIFYYTGYAGQSEGDNYFLPVDFDPRGTGEVAYSAYSASRILADLQGAKPGFLAFLVDAAWDAPQLRRRFPEPGLARIELQGPNALVGMSAGAGRTIYDDPAKPNSLYTEALVGALQKQGLTLSQVAEDVKRSVVLASGGNQIPMETSTVIGDFYVNPQPPDAVAWEKIRNATDPAVFVRFREKFPASPMAGEAAQRAEALDWNGVNKNDPAALQAFADRYPNSRYAAGADKRAGEIKSANESEKLGQYALAALKSYKLALEDRNLEGLKAVWPSLSKDQLSTFREFFKAARTIAIDGTPVEAPEIHGESAVIKCRRNIQYPGQMQSDVATLYLRRQGDGMVIERMMITR